MKALNEPLDAKFVKTRSQSGRNLSYVEAWYVIDRLNQVFGFGAWNRETLATDLIQQETKSSNGRELHWVGYTAKVRVTACIEGEIVFRDGTGFGQGQDSDLGRAHESAIKEAESDAMKRAAMTFGYQFGLALYDKAQEHVENGKPAGKPAEEPTTDIKQSPIAQAAHHMRQTLGMSEEGARGAWKAILKVKKGEDKAASAILGCKTKDAVEALCALTGQALHKEALEVMDGGK